MLRFDISQLLHAAFALRSDFIRYLPQEADEQSPLANFPGASVLKTDAGLDFYAGNRIATTIELGGGPFKTYGANGAPETRNLNALKLPPTTLVEYRRSKIVTKVQAAGGGTFKEVFALGDWELNIFGVAIDWQDQSVEQVLAQLMEREQLASSIPVGGKLFNLLGIERILIESFEAKQLPGSPAKIPFSLTAVSDYTINAVGYGLGADM